MHRYKTIIPHKFFRLGEEVDGIPIDDNTVMCFHLGTRKLYWIINTKSLKKLP